MWVHVHFCWSLLPCVKKWELVEGSISFFSGWGFVAECEKLLLEFRALLFSISLWYTLPKWILKKKTVLFLTRKKMFFLFIRKIILHLKGKDMFCLFQLTLPKIIQAPMKTRPTVCRCCRAFVRDAGNCNTIVHANAHWIAPPDEPVAGWKEKFNNCC